MCISLLRIPSLWFSNAETTFRGLNPTGLLKIVIIIFFMVNHPRLKETAWRVKS